MIIEVSRTPGTGSSARCFSTEALEAAEKAAAAKARRKDLQFRMQSALDEGRWRASHEFQSWQNANAEFLLVRSEPDELRRLLGNATPDIPENMEVISACRCYRHTAMIERFLTLRQRGTKYLSEETRRSAEAVWWVCKAARDAGDPRIARDVHKMVRA